ncbi:MAG TPA: AraC family transcriptional regulator ligand-binding domain-containing protein [Polyangiaceae bacterium]|nr:AraC family transcriptional regulator ligand-binding domain-containing protein [Polyangiaceae bacterium]
MLEAFRVLGLDERRLCAEAEVSEAQLTSGALLPDGVRQRLWASACREAQRDEFAIEAGLALPFGALGLMDYLAASADTLEQSCRTLARHFHRISCARHLEVESCADELRIDLITVETRIDTPAEPADDDFVLAALLGRLRARVDGFSLAGVRLRRAPPPSAARFTDLFGAPVSFGHAVATLCVPAQLREAQLTSADPWLRRTLEALVPPDESGTTGSALERSLRGCLRELLPRERFGAAKVASALGMSERSLHRRLRELGQSYQGLVDGFRREEAERLLREGRMDMAEIAHRLGFADQSAFSRAFRRWTRMAPRDWLALATR